MKRWVGLLTLVCGVMCFASAGDAQETKITVNRPVSTRGWVGIYMQERSITDSSQYPVLVSVEPGSPAQIGGLVAGDTILSFNNINAKGNFHRLQSVLKPGERVTFKVRRNTVRSVTVIPMAAPSAEVSLEFLGPAIAAAIASASAPLVATFQVNSIPGSAAYFRIGLAGAEISDVSEELAEAMQIKISGVLILTVHPGTPAKEAGLKGGDLIVKVDSTRITSSGDLTRAMQNVPSKRVSIELVRKGKTTSRTLKW